ncbi:MAG: hypothetical protein PHX37_05115 [Eubacteriales bacterium]|nr:hypothetical protein [Eubacteriales bacterium]
MKKILSALLIVTIAMSFIAATASAEGSQTASPSMQQGAQDTTQSGTQQGTQNTTQNGAQQSGQATTGEGTQSGGQQGQIYQYRNQFEENKLEAEQLRTRTRAQLEEQCELANEYKAQLRIMNQTYNNMSEQERAANAGEIEALMEQVREVHRYALQISSTEEMQVRNLYNRVEQNGIPTEEEVEEVEEIIDEL